MTKNEFREYLDAAIRLWRKRKLRDDPIAHYYVDAFQSVRETYFGELLPADDSQGET